MTQALKDAAKALHKIASGLGARKILLARGHTLSAPLYESMQAKSLTDEQIEGVALDAFEACVRALAEAGDPGATVFECKDAGGEDPR